MILSLYLQIVDDINSKLAAKELKADNRLESHADLAYAMV
jgi:DNA-binding transcriptional regulator YhcF (GntR family)